MIEEVMRGDIFHSTLDWQTVEEFEDGAREAVEVLIALGELRPFVPDETAHRPDATAKRVM